MPPRLASVKSAPTKFEPSRLAPRRSARVRLALEKLAPTNHAPSRLDATSTEPEKLAPTKCASGSLRPDNSHATHAPPNENSFETSSPWSAAQARVTVKAPPNVASTRAAAIRARNAAGERGK